MPAVLAPRTSLATAPFKPKAPQFRRFSFVLTEDRITLLVLGGGAAGRIGKLHISDTNPTRLLKSRAGGRTAVLSA